MLLTFQKILPGCEEGQREAWQAFLSEYTPAAFQLFDVYLPWTSEQRSQFWREALLARLSQN